MRRAGAVFPNLSEREAAGRSHPILSPTHVVVFVLAYHMRFVDRIRASSYDRPMTDSQRCVMARLSTVVAIAAASAVLLTAPPKATAAAVPTKVMSGELMCPGLGWVTKIWFLGEYSGWHGVNVRPAQQPRTFFDKDRRPLAKYSFTAVKSELVKVWITCSNTNERYSTFRVGRGSTRTICAWGGLQLCRSTAWGECAAKALIGRRNIKTILCLAKG